MSAADLATSLRAALLANSNIVVLLDAYKSSYPIFTRRPAPTDAPYPIILVSPDIALNDTDGIDDFRPTQTRDVTVYGQNNTAQNYRDVEALGYRIREMFHSNRQAITVSGWHVVQINAVGPIPTPTDDDQTVARMVSLTIQLARKE